MKHYAKAGHKLVFYVLYYIPLQQGLKPIATLEKVFESLNVLYYIPLQQGLKQEGTREEDKSKEKVLYYIPLQQGLKRWYILLMAV